MQTIDRVDSLREALQPLREQGTIALVPTMGALHDGHLALVREARAKADNVVVSIFVNPRQFGVNEDLDAYPRTLERDCTLLEAEGVSLVWAPTVAAMYPKGYATNISVTGVSEALCGAARPGHFDGVATVVCKLFNQVRPDFAFFGEKDWQQLAVIRTMAMNLDLVAPHVDRIFGVPTVREADGVAMSSRNRYLTEEQRQQAVVLPRAMQETVRRVRAGESIATALDFLKNSLLAGGFSSVDYAEIRHNMSLLPAGDENYFSARLFVAAHIGTTRLIDNIPM